MNTKDDIKKELEVIFNETNEYLKMTDDETFKKRVNGKWSIAQNIDHLTISNWITALTLNMPNFMLKQLFGTNNRADWNYDEVVWKYQQKLNAGAKASLPFQPKISFVPVRSFVESPWQRSSSGLLNSIEKSLEEDLDTYLIPHPILGKITRRELLFFTVYHIRHHLNTIRNIK